MKNSVVPPMTSPISPKISSIENGELSNTFLLAVISGSILLLYSLSRIIALHRRVKDLEARPPVDDIVMRGLIRNQLNELLNAKKDVVKAPPVDTLHQHDEEEEDDVTSFQQRQKMEKLIFVIAISYARVREETKRSQKKKNFFF